MVNLNDILDILPQNMRNIIENVDNLKELQEIRIKVNKPIILNSGSKEIILKFIPTREDVKTILQRISRFSIYAYEEEIRQGYITINGGHRIGICGVCVIEENKVKIIKDIVSLNIRICKEIKGCSDMLMDFLVADGIVGSAIVISPPQCGKTTLIRDIARNLSNGYPKGNIRGYKVCVVDERSEICACFNGLPQMDTGIRTDVLDNCPKSEGIMMAIRSMSPEIIICDEIGTYKDMESVLMAMNSGVSIISTIHGYGVEDLYERAVFKQIVENKVFKKGIVLSKKMGAGTIESIYDFEKNTEIWRRYNA